MRLTLSGTNTFGGGTTLSAGTLNINNASALGASTGTFTISGGTIDNTSGGSITTSNYPQSWGGNFTFTGTNALNLGTGAVAMSAARQVTVSASTLTVGGVIAGSTFGLTKAGAGTLTLTGSNTYTGNTTISAGTLNANSTSALGGASNTLIFSGGTLQAGGTITSPSTRPVTLTASTTGTIDTNGNSVSIAGVISSSGALVKSGTGTLTLTGTNTYSGSTTISAGTLNANASAAIGDGSATNTLVLNGGTLQAAATITSPSTRGVSMSSTGTIDTNGQTVSIAGAISGSGGALTKSGTGTLTLSGTNTFTPGLSLSAGQLNVNSATALGTGTLTVAAGTTIDNTSGGAITESNNNAQAWNGNFTFTGSNALNLGTGAVAMSASRQVTVSGSTLTVGGVISGSTFSLTKLGAGALTLSGTNTFTGGTTLSAGTLNINNAQALGTVAGTFTISGGTIDNTSGGSITTLNYPQSWGGNFTFTGTNALNLGTGAVAMSASRQVTVSGSTLTVGGVISGATFGLTKLGAGTMTLSGNNTYNGTTTVSRGSLIVNGSQGSSAVSLNGGTLSGTGTTGAITSTASGGTLAPGNPAPGILNSGNVNLATGSPTFSVALNGTTVGTGYSQQNVTGTVNLTGATLSASLGYVPTNGDSYTIIANDSTDAVTGTFSGLPEGTGLVIGGKSFRISYVGGTGNDVVLTAGGATKLAVTSVPASATVDTNFSVTVQSQDANGNCVQVNSNTGISLASDGAGTLSGNTGTITAGTCSVTLSSVQTTLNETIHLTASRTSGDSLTTSVASSAIVVAKANFVTNTAVAIVGTPTVGTASTLTAGSYTPAPTGTSYQWRLCNSSGASCADISGATASTYTPVAGDVGGTLRVVETVTRAGYNNGSSTSAASPVVINGSFVTNTAVAIVGTPTVGTASTLTAGSYTPTPTGSSYQWRLCDSSGASCADISGATSSTYTPVAGDVGGTLRVVETVTKSGYNNGSSTSAASPVVINGTFVTNTAVAIVGTPTVGTASTLTAGSYTPTPTGTSYQWRLCDSSGASCADISGATASTYTPIAGDVGGTLRVVETVTKSGYNNGSSTSAASPVVINGSFVTNTAVAINGTPTVGTASTLTAGSYTPTPTGTSYQWRLCNSSGASCADISGATSSTYTPVAGDVGGTLRVVETVTKSGYNNGSSTSAASPVVINGSFVTNTAVSINGTPTVGTASTLTAGSYTPAPTGTSYQWRLCNSSGASCADISGATASTYTPVAGDVGGTLRVVETVTKSGYNNGGSTSAASPVVINGTFVTNTAVAINGTPTVDTASTLTAGSYTPAPTGTSYQWRLCDSSGASCADIGGATSSTYTPVAGDVGGTLRVVETVTRAGYNNGSSTSAASPVVINGSFVTNTAVAINGTPTVGTASTLTAGSYTPAQTGTSYQWRLCDGSGGSCADISGATSSTYTPVAGDVGGTLRVVETVTRAGYNNGGSTSAASPAVIKGSFTTTSVVVVNGTPIIGTPTTITNGVYAPTFTTRSYQWELCNSSGGSCSNIGGATGSSYTPVPGDLGSTLRVVETVTRAGYNDGGSTSAASALVVVGVITTTTGVAINGTPTVDTATTITAGSYSPAPTSSAYQWELCDSAGNNCSDISGATSTTYTPVASDAGSSLRVVETVSKSGYADGTSTSGYALVAKATFTTNTAVSITGTPTVGTASTLSIGSYTPAPTSRSYQWKLCDSSGGSCTNISGATSATYTPVAGDVGSTLRVVETTSKAGYDNGGSTSAASPVVINGSFSTTTAVAVNGTPAVGAATTLTAGSYTPAPTSRSYQWELCDSSGGSCSNIGGATSATYMPVAGDIGSTLRVVETASKAGYNDGGSTSAASAVVVKGSFSTTTAVAINGAPSVGVATAITNGVYSPVPGSRSYQWKLCDSSGGSCVNIGGATSSTYTPVSGDVGSTLRVVETVTLAGYNDGSSTSSAVAVGGTFSTTTAVSINGTPKVGTKSTITAGTYAPSPTGGSYQWKRCDSAGSNCAPIAGATFVVYTPVAGDVGKTLRVVETATKPFYVNGGSTSAATALVVKGTFVKNTTVQIFGYPKRGVTSHVTQGSYTPTPTSRTYQWLRCSSTSLASCVNIAGATKSTYKPGNADTGKRLRVVETVSKSGYNNLSVTSAAAKVQ